MVESSIPLSAADVAAPILKLCPANCDESKPKLSKASLSFAVKIP